MSGIMQLMMLTPVPLSVVSSPSAVSGSDTPATFIVGTTTASGIGGTAPYSYAWTRISGSTAITATSPSNATTSFQAASLSEWQTVEAVFRVTVTDAASDTATFDVTVSGYRIGSGDPP